MITSYLRRIPKTSVDLVDGLDYMSVNKHDLFFFPFNENQRNFSDRYIYEKNGNRFTNGEDWHIPVDGFSYAVNKDGWHGTDFVENPQILCAGCSVTIGFGLDYSETWPHVLADWRDCSVNVIGAPGATIAKIVYMVFSHVGIYGWPEEIHLCLPDIHRGSSSVERGGRIEETPIWYNVDTGEYHTHKGDEGRFGSFKIQSIDGTSRKPSLNSVVRENMMALDCLSLVCQSLGVPLRISTHVGSTHQALCSSDFVYPGYVTLVDEMLDDASIEVGHPHLCCDLKDRGGRWTYAVDQIHPGAHAHIHIAEAHAGEVIR